jgi:hypothetical protein
MKNPSVEIEARAGTIAASYEEAITRWRLESWPALVSAFVAEARGKIHVEALPSYAPDLNPVEGMWRHLKEVELANVSCLDLDQLHQELHLALGRLRQKRDLVQSFFEGAELAA